VSFPRYSECKPSGIEWLGLVPETWSIKRLRFAAQINPSKSEIARVPRDTVVSFLPMEAISDDGALDLERTRRIGEVETGYTYFREGDVTVAKITPCFENGKGAVMRELVGGIGFGTTELTVARPRQGQTSATYLHWLFNSALFRSLGEASMYGAGGQKRVPDDFFRDFAISFPPLDEQTIIVAFLNRETAKIDALVAEQEKLISLLKEKRQALISHAVTKGLDPNVPMKDSGIEWLGQVPAHWTVTPLKWLVDPSRPIMYGIVLPGPDVGEGIPVLKGGNVKPARMRLDEMARTTPEIEAPYARARLKAGDLVYSIRGSIGDCEIVPKELEGSNITQDVARVAVAEGVIAMWVRWALLSAPVREELASGSLGAAVRGVNIFDLKRADLPTPPVGEQRQIGRFLDNETSKIDRLMHEAERATDLLAERRRALISAAVTGKVDVRGLFPTTDQ